MPKWYVSLFLVYDWFCWSNLPFFFFKLKIKKKICIISKRNYLELVVYYLYILWQEWTQYMQDIDILTTWPYVHAVYYRWMYSRIIWSKYVHKKTKKLEYSCVFHERTIYFTFLCYDLFHEFAFSVQYLLTFLSENFNFWFLVHDFFLFFYFFKI